MRKFLAMAGLVSLLVAGADAAATAATPASDHACGGTACLTVSPLSTSELVERGNPVGLEYTLAVTGAPANLVVTVHNSSGLTPNRSSVRIDGVAPAAVTVTGSNLTVTLPGLAVGSHPLSFGAALTKLTDQSSYATATVTDGLGGASGTATSASIKATVDKPDFKISEFGTVSGLVAGGEANAAVNIFGDQSAAARLDLTAPAGFSVVSVSDGTTQKKLTCAPTAPPAGRVSCLGSFTGITLLDILVKAASTDPIGHTGSLVATVVPLGIPDATPADNTVRIPLKVVGTAAVVATITPQVKAIYRNHATNYTITVTNQGPDTATGVQTSIVLETNFRNVFSLAVPRPLVITHNGNPEFPGYAIWHIGTLRTGQSVSVTVTVRGSQVAATAFLGIGEFQSDTLNPKQCIDRACNFAAGRSLIVTAQPAPTGAGNPILPATGGPVRVPLGLGLLALLSGAVLLVAGRRRTTC